MTGHLTRFAQSLRAAGLPVSTADVLDAARAVAAAGLVERETFRLALRACLVKSALHHTPFDRLFDSFFHVDWPAGKREKSRQRGGGGQPVNRRQANAQTPGSGPPRDAPHTPGAPSHAERPAAAPRQTGELETARAQLRDVAERGELVRRTALARARSELSERERGRPGRVKLDRRWSADELLRLEREAERLGRLLALRLGRRWRRTPHGRVDPRATIAASARTLGVPLRPVRHQPRVSKSRLLVLCDVSGSVIRSARLLLAMLNACGRLFDGGHSFVFVDRPVAAPLRGLELERLPGLDLQASSDFGHVFYKLLTEHAELLTPRTAVLVLGDARCNRFDPQAWAFEELARRVGRVVWLNPERRERWYTGDSRLRDYEPHVHALLAAESLDELAAGIERLATTGELRRRG